MSQPLHSFSRNRHCGNCQGLMLNQAIFQKNSCGKCSAGVPLVNTQWDENGWGRCPLCFCFFHRTHIYCEVCGWFNQIGAGLKRKREMEAHRLEKAAKAARIAELENLVKVLEGRCQQKEEEEGDALLSSIDDKMLDAGAFGSGTAAVLKSENCSDVSIGGSSESLDEQGGGVDASKKHCDEEVQIEKT